MGRNPPTWPETEIFPEQYLDTDCVYVVGSADDIRFDAFASDIGPFESPRHGWWGIGGTEFTTNVCRPEFAVEHYGREPHIVREYRYQYLCAGCGKRTSVVWIPDVRPFCLECVDKW